MRVRDWLVDAGISVALLAAMVAERHGGGHGSAGALALSVAIAGGLGLRRRAPLAGYLIGSVALSAEALLTAPSAVSPYANLIGLYSLGVHGPRIRARLGPAIVVPGMAVYFAATGTSAVLATGTLSFWLLAWAIGYTGARRRDEREAAREQLRTQVLTEERRRIAIELHDLLGHTLNVMLVQAGAARLSLDRDPGQSRELLASMEETGRTALDELDRMLEAHPGAPGLAGIDSLTQRLGLAGIRVETRIEVGTLAPEMERSVYRIVQEALTNAVKHGRATTAGVAVTVEDRTVVIDVRDDGAGPPDGYAPGRGLRGIAERAARFGGSATHGPAGDGGFRVRALVLTTFQHDESVMGALRAGASGFLLKRASPERLIDAVRTVAAGDALLDPAVTRELVAHFVGAKERARDPRFDGLTERERQVLTLVAGGHSNAELAGLLGIAESTAKTHVKRVLAKIGARDRAQAVVIAYRGGLISP